MDRSERLALTYLESLRLGHVVHEPDGNIPPDFLVDGRIAVEVRRLNQNEETANGHRGLEETSIPLNRSIKKLLASLGPSVDGVSWYVSYSFERPIAAWKDLELVLVQTLANGRRNGLDELEDVEVLRGFRVSMQRSGRLWPNAFVLGAWVDHNSGGFVVSELERNLRLCITEKTQKVASVRYKYPEWWLLFLDHIGYGGDRDELRALEIPHSWDRVVLVSPIDPTLGCDLPPSSEQRSS